MPPPPAPLPVDDDDQTPLSAAAAPPSATATAPAAVAAYTYAPTIQWQPDVEAYLSACYGGPEALHRMSSALSRPPLATCLRVNTQRTTPDDLLRRLPAALAPEDRTLLLREDGAERPPPYLHPLLPQAHILPRSGPHAIDSSVSGGCWGGLGGRRRGGASRHRLLSGGWVLGWVGWAESTVVALCHLQTAASPTHPHPTTISTTLIHTCGSYLDPGAYLAPETVSLSTPRPCPVLCCRLGTQADERW